MSIGGLAFHNFKRSFRNYVSMILSLAFTVLILFNFANLTYAETFQALGERNKDYIDIIIQVISVVLVCFMFFFIWYAMNVFLTKRKKEIGIYIFMGLTNQRIARLYMLEIVMTGMVSLLLGLFLGVVTTQLFQMILLKISEVSVELSFRLTWQPIVLTVVVYIVVYTVFVVKGYVNIVRSSVLEMISAARTGEYVKTNQFILFLKAVLGIGVLSYGYYLSGKSDINGLLLTTILVIVGTYLIFGGFLPILFQQLAKRKRFLYKNERTLWMNNVIFRMRKNYRTYAITCVLLTCSIVAIAAAFSQKARYDKMIDFMNTYTFQIISNRADLEEEVTALIEKDNEIVYHTTIPFFGMEGSCFSNGYGYGILAFSDVQKVAKEAGLEFPYESLADDELIEARNLPLMSFMPEVTNRTVEINGETFHLIDDVGTPYLGYLQDGQSYYIVNDKIYEKLLMSNPGGIPSPYYTQIYTYNYRIKDIHHYQASMDELDSIVYSAEDSYVARIAVNPDSEELAWIKVEYSLCVFVFLVFVLASGSILFMKLYNDAFEEKERYIILKKMGASEKRLGKAAAREIGIAYGMPFVLMMLSAYFAVHALEKIMSSKLLSVYIVSVLIILGILLLFYGLSVIFYKKNANAA
ncbi:MAG: FtsX-like permease family protein [Muribaculaceae bacterium]|nr:FtsX-like permease family protein [Muribaculaceae bacterium]